MFRQLIALPLIMALLISSAAFGKDEDRTNEAFRAKLFRPEGTGWQSEDVVVNIEHDQIVLRSPNGQSEAVTIAYREIKGIEYSHSKSRRKIRLPMALAANAFAFPLLLNQVESHWLTVQSERHETVLNLDKDNYQSVLAALETNLGRKVTGWNLEAAAVSR
jgi:hypothetical protein